MRRRSVLFASLLLLVIVLVSCSSPSRGTGESVSVSVSPTDVTLAPGEEQVFTAEVQGAVHPALSWEASAGTLETSETSVTYTAPGEPGTYEVSATSVEDPSASASANVTVDPGSPGPTSIIIVAGNDFSLFLDPSGHAWAWGRNSSGTLGDGTTTHRNAPVQVNMPTGVTFTTLHAGGGYTSLSSGSGHTLALDRDGRAWAWGANYDGRLGDGTTTARSAPVRVNMPAGETFTVLDAGGSYSVALDEDGNAWAWGDDYYGQLGDGAIMGDEHEPAKVSMPFRASFKQLAAGGDHVLALDPNAAGWGWGGYTSGAVGNGSIGLVDSPDQVTMPSGVSFEQIAAGGSHSLALDQDGDVWAWGSATHGQLGTGKDDAFFGETEPVHVRMPAGVSFAQVAAGRDHSLALDENGDAWAWGRNEYGQLGNGTTTDRSIPIRVNMPAGVTFAQIAGGQDHSLALDENGHAWAWGRNYFGQLGNGTFTDQHEPVRAVFP